MKEELEKPIGVKEAAAYLGVHALQEHLPVYEGKEKLTCFTG